METTLNAIPTAAMRGTDSAALATDLAIAQNDLDIITGAAGAVLDTAAVDALWAKALSDLATGAPSATASVLEAINWLYTAWRNKTTTTTSLLTVYKDDGITELARATVADDGTTFTKSELETGV